MSRYVLADGNQQGWTNRKVGKWLATALRRMLPHGPDDVTSLLHFPDFRFSGRD
jgi:hypothetical protein